MPSVAGQSQVPVIIGVNLVHLPLVPWQKLDIFYFVLLPAYTDSSPKTLPWTLTTLGEKK